jgi:hypothetical protein
MNKRSWYFPAYGSGSHLNLTSLLKRAETAKTESVVRKVKVLVANRPRLMKDLVLATIGDQPDIEVVGETQDEAEITELVERTRPDYLIIAMEDPDVRPGLCGFLLGRYPQMKILSLAAERNSGIFYWAFVDIRSRHVESSEQGILDVLRSKPELVEI